VLANGKRLAERLHRALTYSELYAQFSRSYALKGSFMNSIIYIVGLIVIVVAILSFLGLR